MAYTAQDVVDLAVQRSALNDADLVPDAQLLGYITNSERRIYLLGARLNPNFFGAEGNTAVRADETEHWNLAATPGNIAAIAKLEAAALVGTPTNPTVSVGDEINLVDFRYPNLQISPRAYVRGRRLYDWNNELSTNGSNYVSQVKVYYSQLPAAITTMTQSINLPDEWIDLLIVPLARILSLRDKREEEAQFFDQEYQLLIGQFQEEMLVYEYGATRALGAVPAIPFAPPSARE